MEAHSWTMKGPLNTDNIRAQDGTLAATIADSTGDINFQRDIEARDIDARRNLTVFNNLEVQGPLAEFIQNISVGGNAAIVGQATMGSGIVNTNLTAGGSVAANQLYSASLTDTVTLRVRGGGPAAGKQLQAADALGNLEFGGLPSIPIGSIILFESNTQITGYTLLTDQDDDVVYITKGTAAGGEAGGTPKVGGTWSHAHGVSGVTFPHNHKWKDWVPGSLEDWSWDSDGSHITMNQLISKFYSRITLRVTSGDGWGPLRDFWTQISTASASGNTDNNTVWRPKGRNWTRQQRD